MNVSWEHIYLSIHLYKSHTPVPDSYMNQFGRVAIRHSAGKQTNWGLNPFHLAFLLLWFAET